jgi:ketosteroid isomerase-like protein
MAASDIRRVIVGACALWEAGDLPRLLSHFMDDVVFTVHARANAPSMLGDGLGKVLLARRLEALLDEVEVETFDLHEHSLTTDGIWHFCRVSYRYRHHASGEMIEGSMRQKWGFVGAGVAQFEIFHDADRMRAFYDFAGRIACNT